MIHITRGFEFLRKSESDENRISGDDFCLTKTLDNEHQITDNSVVAQEEQDMEEIFADMRRRYGGREEGM